MVGGRRGAGVRPCWEEVALTQMEEMPMSTRLAVDEHGGLEGGAHADDGAAELACAQLLQRILGRRVGLDQGETTREACTRAGFFSTARIS